MDEETTNAIADLKYQLSQLQSALGSATPDAAESEVASLRVTVVALAAWAATVNPPFQGQA